MVVLSAGLGAADPWCIRFQVVRLLLCTLCTHSLSMASSRMFQSAHGASNEMPGLSEVSLLQSDHNIGMLKLNNNSNGMATASSNSRLRRNERLKARDGQDKDEMSRSDVSDGPGHGASRALMHGPGWHHSPTELPDCGECRTFGSVGTTHYGHCKKIGLIYPCQHRRNWTPEEYDAAVAKNLTKENHDPAVDKLFFDSEGNPVFLYNNDVIDESARFSFTMEMDGETDCLSSNEYQDDDTRDTHPDLLMHSIYVYATSLCHRRITFAGEPDPNGGWKIKATNVPTKLGERGFGTGWYLTVHDYYPSDAVPPDGFRLILHHDPAKAATWDLDLLFEGAPAAMNLVYNYDRTWSSRNGDGKQWAWAPAHVRSGISTYLAVMPDSPNNLMITAQLE